MNEPSRTSRKTGVAIAVTVIALLVVIFWKPLVSWFDPSDRRDSSTVESGPNLSAETVEELRSALGSYEQIRLLLANDTTDSVAAYASDLAAALRGAREHGLPTESGLSEHLRDATASAEAMTRGDDIAILRDEFGRLSEHLAAVVGASSALQQGWFLFSCPMVEEPGLWLQPSDELENPYMGARMLTCGSREEWPRGSVDHVHQTGGSVLAPEDAEVAYWTCPMHPSVRQSGPGACPICGMDLLPVSESDVASGVLLIDDSARRRIGLKTSMVERKPVTLTVRAVGRTTYDETRLRDVTLKLDGWVERLLVDETGQAVRRGQTLLTIYSPELYAAQQEYLLALKSQRGAQSTATPERADYLVRAARERLRLWDLTDAQIAQIEQRGEPLERMPILSPVTGFVIEKNVVEGAAVQKGERLFRVAGLDVLWIEADVAEKDLSSVREGQTALIRLPSLPGSELAGQITYVYPYLNPQTRTGRIRIEVPNRGLELRPEMFANVEIRVDRGERTVIPDSAVIRTGPRELVFLDLGEGRLEPREIETGARGDGVYEVISGVEPGDVVVTSANFLVSSESRLRSAAIWESDSER